MMDQVSNNKKETRIMRICLLLLFRFGLVILSGCDQQNVGDVVIPVLSVKSITGRNRNPTVWPRRRITWM